ncbi:MAG: calcium-binding protein [Pseudomonadota bacterium]
MTNAKIEIKARDVNGSHGIAQHMYILYTNEAGVKRVLSAFPEHNTVLRSLFDDIVVVYKNYNINDSDDFPKLGEFPHPSKILFEGTDIEVSAKINLALAEMSRINSQGYDYNFPIYEAILPNSSWSELNKQNSNTVAMYLAASMGLQSGVIDFVNDYYLNVPGYFATLNHSPFEKNMTSLVQALEQIGNQVHQGTAEILSIFIDKIIVNFKEPTTPTNNFIEQNTDFFHSLLQTSIGDGFTIKYGTDGGDIFLTSQGGHLIIGGDGSDTANYSSAQIGIDADMGAHSVIVGYSSAPDGAIANQDILVDIENITGSNFGDIILGDSNNNIIIAHDGNDELDGGDGVDMIYGGRGNDVLDGGDGDDYLFGGGSQNTGANEDEDILRGGDGNDHLIADDQTSLLNNIVGFKIGSNDILEGGKGDDYLSGFNGDDSYIYNIGDGKDIIEEHGNYIPFYSYGDVHIQNFNPDDYHNHDVIMFGQGINKEDILFSTDNGSLVITFANNPNDQITIKDGLIGDKNRIETLKFFDGQTIDLSNLDLFTFNFNGSEGNDMIIGSDYFDIVNSGGGDDNINTAGNNDIIDAGIGNDKIDAGNGNDYVVAGEGDDEVNTGNGNDYVVAGEGDDKINTGNGYDIIKAGKGDDIIYGGNDWENIAVDDNDYIIESTIGRDTYIYNVDDGKDIIDEQQSGLSDKIIFGQGILKEDLLFFKSGEDLLIKFKNNDSDQIIIKNQLSNLEHDYQSSQFFQIETLEFFDGVVIDLTKINSITMLYNSDNAQIEGDDYQDSIIAGDSDNQINSYYGDDYIDAGAGNDVIYASEGDDMIIAGKGNDTIYGGDESYIYGEFKDNDTYVYNIGDGQDVIYDYHGSESGGDIKETGRDRIIFGEGIAASDLIFSVANGDIVINFNNRPEDQITIKKVFYSNISQIEILQFADGNILNLNDIDSISITQNGDEFSNVLKGSGYIDIISGNQGNDEIYGYEGNDIISGGEGDDYLAGGNDFIDYIFDQDGNITGISSSSDSYLYNIGDGKDIIDEQGGRYNNNDKIIFGEGIEGEDLLFSTNDSGDLIINFFGSENDQINIKEFFISNNNQIETIQFADNSTLDIKDFNLGSQEGDIEITGSADNDNLFGSGLNNIISGLQGDDYLAGESGLDTYIYNSGDGNDVIYDYDFANNKIVFGAGISKDDVILQMDNVYYSLIIKFNNQDGQITVLNHFYQAGATISTLQFQDGEIDLTAVDNIVITQNGNSEDEYFSDTYYQNNINAGDGDDEIDIYHQSNTAVSTGAGNDIIYISQNSSQITTINDFSIEDKINLFDFEITDINTIASQQGNDVVLDLGDNQKIILKNFNINNLNNNQFELPIFGGEGDDLIVGNQGDNLIDAGNGNNQIQSFAGDDDILSGDGNDIIDAGLGYNYIESGAGNDRISTTSGDDTIFAGEGDDIISSGAGNDYIEGGAGSDKFIITAENIDGQTTIADFEFNNLNEKIDLSAFTNIRNFNDLIITEGSAIINLFNGQIIHILNARPEDMKAENFIFYNAQSSHDIQNTITGTNSKDTLTGTNLNDQISGGANADILYGGLGNDTLLGGSSDDILIGGEGSDILDGGTAIDTASYNDSNAAVIVNLTTNINQENTAQGGTAQGDTFINIENLIGSNFNDNLTGNNLNNVIDGGSGNDIINGGAGNDKIIGGAGADIIDGGDGIDTIHYTSSNSAVNINLSTNVNQGGTAQGDTFTNIENITGSDFSDNLTGDNNNNLIYGGAGNDNIFGQDGNDTLYGGAHNDIINGNNGNDKLIGDTGNDILIGGAGADNLTGGAGRDSFVFNFFSESSATIDTNNITNIDTITDFKSGEDKIDLHNLNLLNHNISFDNNPNDDQTPEGLSYHFDNDNNTVIEHHDGNQDHDFAIKIVGKVDLGGGDFGF